MSSSYFLTRAINVYPDYARFKVDVKTMFGDEEVLGKRVSDIRNGRNEAARRNCNFYWHIFTCRPTGLKWRSV